MSGVDCSVCGRNVSSGWSIERQPVGEFARGSDARFYAWRLVVCRPCFARWFESIGVDGSHPALALADSMGALQELRRRHCSNVFSASARSNPDLMRELSAWSIGRVDSVLAIIRGARLDGMPY